MMMNFHFWMNYLLPNAYMYICAFCIGEHHKHSLQKSNLTNHIIIFKYKIILFDFAGEIFPIMVKCLVVAFRASAITLH